MKVLITEKQCKKLFEAKKEGFRLDYLSSCNTYDEMINYCVEMLGEPIGVGSSRVVFQIDDETVLKLARNDKGNAQNKEEINIGLNSGLIYVPKVFNGSDEKNGNWIISEFVLPAKKGDFRKVFGIKFDDIADFCYHLQESGDNCFLSDYHKKRVQEIYDDYSWCVNGTKLLKEISILYEKHNSLVNDLVNMGNWGLCRRNGKTYMVMLDSGCSLEVYNRYYRLRF